jgi:cation diffusion facilitator family transporter
LHQDESRAIEAQKITIVGFIINGFLTAFKIWAGTVGKSGAMIADGIHSLSDFITDIIVIIGFRFTKKPEDEKHNYGHGKIETVMTIIISLFLILVGFKLFKSGAINIFLVLKGTTLPSPKIVALIAAIVSILTKEILYRYTVIVGKKINSSALIANAWHHRSDAFSSIGAAIGIGGAVLLGNKWTILDPVASVIVSIFIIKVGVEILFPAVNELLECSLSKTEIDEIKKIITSSNEIKEYHKLRSRKIGNKNAVEFHMLVDKKMNVEAAHDIANDIEYKLKELLGIGSIITIHIEPYMK